MTIEKTYLSRLEHLKQKASLLPKTRTMALARIDTLIRMNMRWEMFQLDKTLKAHPFEITHGLVDKAIEDLEIWESISFCDSGTKIEKDFSSMEDEHHDLFQSLWTSFDRDQYLERIKLYNLRLLKNELHSGFFDNARVIDMGCGHGNFAHAMLNAGASSVLAIDFGEESITYANNARDLLGISKDKLRFKLQSVYSVSEPDESFDIAVQNGVFHHLEDENKAYQEMYRLLKPGGWAWIYTEGEGSIARDLFHVSVQILADVPASLVQEHLVHLGFSINKRYHLGDALNAIYRTTSLDEITDRLKSIGFNKFRRLIGGVDTDLDINGDDPWANEKFGEGDIRMLIRKPLN